MSPDLGRFALALALVLSVAHAALAWRAVGAGAGEAIARQARAASMAAGALTLAFVVLIAAFVQSDFSVANVLQNSHPDKPLGYKIAGAWGNHEGSMVLWCLLLAVFAAALARDRSVDPDLRARAGVVIGLMSAAFISFTLFSSNPFDRIDAPPFEGLGLNPLLQDPALAAHPPTLYVGYLGLAVPFALAVAALWRGRAGSDWARAMRPYLLVAFMALTVGIALGAFWAYYELGWGGWWFWDPVENASLMPWLVAAALLHSAIVTEKRGLLGPWTALLAILGFGFAIFGTFLVRSGVLTSVHAFANDPERGAVLLMIFAIATGVGFILFALRAGRIASPGRDFEAVSRETGLVANNVFLLSAAAVILLGTLYPVVSEALFSQRASVGAPYFEAAAAPLMGLPLLIAPLIVMIPWRRGKAAPAALRLRAAGVIALGAAVAMLALSRGAHVGAAVACALGVWLIAGAVVDLAWRARWGRDGLGAAAGRLKRAPAGVIGAALAHAGVGVFLIGAAAGAAFPVERHAMMQPGDQIEAGGRTIVFERINAETGPNFIADRASFLVTDAAGRAIRLRPAQRFYPVSNDTTAEVAIRADMAGDLYIALGAPQARENGEIVWAVRVLMSPLIWMVFAGPVMIALGGLVSFIQRRRPSPAAAVEDEPGDDAPAPAPAPAE